MTLDAFMDAGCALWHHHDPDGLVLVSTDDFSAAFGTVDGGWAPAEVVLDRIFARRRDGRDIPLHPAPAGDARLGGRFRDVAERLVGGNGSPEDLAERIAAAAAPAMSAHFTLPLRLVWSAGDPLVFRAEDLPSGPPPRLRARAHAWI